MPLPLPSLKHFISLGLLCTRMRVQSKMKRRDLERRLRELGWSFIRSGGNHDVWSDGERQEAVPRHREINERLALAILRRARRK
jgi:mRNA interferase HicA